MADKAQSIDAASSDDTPVVTPAAGPPAPARRPGHRGADVRDTVAEMAARAHEISQEAGSKMAAAMKDVINAAAGLAGFAVESARDLVQFMVRRGQMTQEEGDRLLRDAEAAYARRKPAAPAAAPASSNGDAPAVARPAAARSEVARAESPKGAAPAAPRGAEPAAKESAPRAKKGVSQPTAAKAPTKAAGKSAPKPPAKAAGRSAPKSAAKAPARAAVKAKAPAKAKAPVKPAARKAAPAKKAAKRK